jgi:hypothetical protein
MDLAGLAERSIFHPLLKYQSPLAFDDDWIPKLILIHPECVGAGAGDADTDVPPSAVELVFLELPQPATVIKRITNMNA